MKKVIVIGIFLTAFLMVVTPCISAVSIHQTKESRLEIDEISELEEIEILDFENIIYSRDNDYIEELQNIFNEESTNIFKNIAFRVLGVIIIAGVILSIPSLPIMIVALPAFMFFISFLNSRNLFTAVTDTFLFAIALPFVFFTNLRIGMYLLNPLNRDLSIVNINDMVENWMCYTIVMSLFERMTIF